MNLTAPCLTHGHIRCVDSVAAALTAVTKVMADAMRPGVVTTLDLTTMVIIRPNKVTVLGLCTSLMSLHPRFNSTRHQAPASGAAPTISFVPAISHQPGTSQVQPATTS